ncbi:hypothetical protein FACS1894151_05220 [Spirochaetia bacterium]|nr:hypothetical protein FACS1894151_05220 [Spirochaetia bacterium]
MAKRKTGKRKKKSSGTPLTLVLVCVVVVLVLAALCVFWAQKKNAAGNETAGGTVQTIADKTAEKKPLPGTSETVKPELPAISETIKVCSFNIQIFGVSKMGKPQVVAILTDIVSQFDIIAIQEVRSADPAPVIQFMNGLPARYDYVLGPREGRSSSKEQYWVIYDREKLEVLGADTWADPEDVFERNPLGVFFQTKGKFDFVLINNHIQPSAAGAEISLLPEAVSYYRDLWDEHDMLIVGDFNADGQYYNENLLESVFQPSNYVIILSNEFDTTVGAADNTYDRFIISSAAAEDYTGARGVIRFDELYDFSVLDIAPSAVSDHYPVWAEFDIWNDTD